MQNNVVGWFEIYVSDMARAKTFYEAVFQKTLMKLDTSPDMDMWAFPWEDNASGAAGALVQHPMGQAGTGGTMVYFSCADCATEAARAAAAGGSVCQDKMSIGEYGFIAIVMDTEGNAIGLHSMV